VSTSTPDPTGSGETPAPGGRPPAIRRPNGKVYRPRKVVVRTWDNEEAYGVFDDYGVFVLGTHNIVAAEPLATERIRRQWDSDLVAVKPERRWVRLGYLGGELAWIEDPERGRAAVQFHAEYAAEERAS
jgi:hypothetical protein